MPVVHGAAQLRTRWGKDGTRTILDTCGTKMFLPGISDPETLEMASKLAGDAAFRERGHEHDSRHPVMTEDMIRRLPASSDGTGYAFILRGNLSPVIAKPPVIWHGRRRKALMRALSEMISERGVLGGEVAPPALDPAIQPGEPSLEDLSWPGHRPLDDLDRELATLKASRESVGPWPDAEAGPPPSRAPRPWDQLSDTPEADPANPEGRR
jgi:hypothetical protein